MRKKIVYKKKPRILLVLLLLLNFSCSSQTSFVIKDIPLKYFNSSFHNYDSLEVLVDLTRYLPADYSTKGDVDYTEFIQKGLEENNKVKFPDFPILINNKGLTVYSNSILYFSKESKLLLKPSNQEKYEIIRLHNIENVDIYNPQIYGDRNTRTDTKGEWGMGIAIRGATKDVNIYNSQIYNCWGDGIYLGHLNGNSPSDITINNVLINNCRRNGISITTGVNVEITNALICNINGTNPQSGVVIEPSNKIAEFVNISLKNIITYNNLNSGIQIGGFETLLKRSNTNVSITITNHIDESSDRGLFIGRIRNIDENNNIIKGKITINNPTWINNKSKPYIIRKQNNRGAQIEINGLSRNKILEGIDDSKKVKFNSVE